ncbi:hypothetical protein T4B_8845 [Trichinella pseudospiralis]|uniref:Uncharacterized protein n=1 Tax=Trichinella pseudospiralis TaxID=6337 RepID=A0A0V1IQJ9_TRIPS|nr:hypothetical protein T4B_8845 [Trichinella pseudospiralis]
MSLFVSCSGVWDVVELNCNRISSDPPAHKLENPRLGVASCKSDCAAVGGKGGGGGGGGVGVLSPNRLLVAFCSQVLFAKLLQNSGFYSEKNCTVYLFEWDIFFAIRVQWQAVDNEMRR